MKNRKNRKAFTLIELLVVIAIIAILSVVVILTLNPAELLRQSRDSNRVSDMATLKSAISLYLADVSTPNLGGASSTCDVSIAFGGGNNLYAPTSAGVYTTPTSTCGYWMNSVSTLTTTTVNSRGITGWASGWIPVNFSAISSGAPIGNEPVDPVNTSGTNACASGALSSCGLFYSYVASGTTFKLGSFMESGKYSHNGSGDVETNDGGTNPYVYEQGTNLAL